MLYGKWRPKTFADVAGQDHIVQTLKNALLTNKVAHAYLFAGPRGTGKTTTARILARAINCENLGEGDPCGECRPCRAIDAGNALDLIEMDAASNRGIDDVRELRDKIGFAPTDLTKKVYLLDEVHMLTDAAFNALLKTLEEPPDHAIFIFATTEDHKVPATITSRCQRFDFRRVPLEAIKARLSFISEQEGFSLPDEGLHAIAVQARGGLRDAITLLEQTVSRYGPTPSADDVSNALGLTFDERSVTLADAIAEGDLEAALATSREVADDGVDMSRFTRATIDLLRERLMERARGGDAGAARPLAAAVAALAEADFRRDPASPVPLEVACATAILGPNIQVVEAAPAAQGSGQRGGQQQRRPSQPRGAANAPGPDASASREERFLDQLYQRCKMVEPLLAAWLNGSCRVLEMDGDELELGFFSPMHMQKVDNDCRTLVEQQATELLKRPVRLKVTQVEREAVQAAATKKGGHLVEAARGLDGAVEVPKDGE